MMTVNEDIISKGRGGMDLAWVLLIWSFVLFLGSPLFLFFFFVFFVFSFYEATRMSPFGGGYM